jgi:hypothetical protein
MQQIAAGRVAAEKLAQPLIIVPPEKENGSLG